MSYFFSRHSVIFILLVMVLVIFTLGFFCSPEAYAAGGTERIAPSAVDDSVRSPQSEPSSKAPDHIVSVLFDALGPFAVFLLLVAAGVGLHLPEDLIIIPAGWEIASGNFPLVWTVVAAYVGVVGGDTGWFLLCRHWGPKLLLSHWFLKSVHPRRVLVIKRLLDRHGIWVLLISRFIPGARTASVAVAGLTHLRWRTFLVVELPMAAITVATQISIGYYAEQGILSTNRTAHWVMLGCGLAALTVIGISTCVVMRKMKRRNIRFPRAKAQWLRDIRGGSRPALLRKQAS